MVQNLLVKSKLTSYMGKGLLLLGTLYSSAMQWYAWSSGSYMGWFSSRCRCVYNSSFMTFTSVAFCLQTKVFGSVEKLSLNVKNFSQKLPVVPNRFRRVSSGFFLPVRCLHKSRLPSYPRTGLPVLLFLLLSKKF